MSSSSSSSSHLPLVCLHPPQASPTQRAFMPVVTCISSIVALLLLSLIHQGCGFAYLHQHHHHQVTMWIGGAGGGGGGVCRKKGIAGLIITQARRAGLTSMSASSSSSSPSYQWDAETIKKIQDRISTFSGHIPLIQLPSKPTTPRQVKDGDGQRVKPREAAVLIPL